MPQTSGVMYGEERAATEQGSLHVERLHENCPIALSSLSQCRRECRR